MIPILLGDGIALFQKGYPMTALQIADCKRYSTGLVSVIYNARRETNGTQPRRAEQRGKKKRRHSAKR